MTEKKYRVWVESIESFHYFDFGNATLGTNCVLFWPNDYDVDNVEEIPNELINEYIGIFDKNGDDIYENDIVRIGEFVGIVSRYEYAFIVEGFYNSMYDNPTDAFENISNVEVIGHVYDGYSINKIKESKL